MLTPGDQIRLVVRIRETASHPVGSLVAVSVMGPVIAIPAGSFSSRGTRRVTGQQNARALIDVSSLPRQGLAMTRAHHAIGASEDLETLPGGSRRRLRRSRAFVAAVAGLGTALAIGGCAASTGPRAVAPTSPASSTGASSAAGASSGAVVNAPDPNAPEVVAAGDIPDNQVFLPVTPVGASFTASVPQGWVQSRDGAATVFTDKFNSVRLEVRPLAAAPDVASVRSQDVPSLQASAPGFALGDVQAVGRTAGSAVLMTYTATSPTNAVTGKSVTEAVERYVFWRGGQEAILTLSGPKGSDNVDPWRKVTDSFRWQP